MARSGEHRRRTLVVMRHAKAEQVALSDAERPLAERGHADAAEAGRWLSSWYDAREPGRVPGRALVSSATRTRETWDGVAAAAGWTTSAEVDRALYEADADAALDLVNAVDPDVVDLVVVGHNPTMASLAQLLDDGEGDPEVTRGLLLGFPTSALAVFELDSAWDGLVAGAARLVAFHVGRA